MTEEAGGPKEGGDPEANGNLSPDVKAFLLQFLEAWQGADAGWPDNWDTTWVTSLCDGDEAKHKAEFMSHAYRAANQSWKIDGYLNAVLSNNDLEADEVDELPKGGGPGLKIDVPFTEGHTFIGAFYLRKVGNEWKFNYFIETVRS